MPFQPMGLTVPFPAVAAFSNTGAVELAPGQQVRIHVSANSIAWILFAKTQAAANAAAIPTPGTPTSAFSMEPGSVEVFQNPYDQNALWVNVCTPNDTSASSSVNFTGGAGEE